ncbi:hypothetical protein HDV00_003035 [Rhizophlyctis rosea]|nr:hypothetical protein HDV00_003035 [Rhizophlyctis rosea]
MSKDPAQTLPPPHLVAPSQSPPHLVAPSQSPLPLSPITDHPPSPLPLPPLPSASPSPTPSFATTTATQPQPQPQQPQPKFSKLAHNLSLLTDRTRSAREELLRMQSITKELKSQCEIQHQECTSLQSDQVAAKSEVDTLMARIEALAGEKIRIQQKLEELKAENGRLEAFLTAPTGQITDTDDPMLQDAPPA